MALVSFSDQQQIIEDDLENIGIRKCPPGKCCLMIMVNLFRIKILFQDVPGWLVVDSVAELIEMEDAFLVKLRA